MTLLSDIINSAFRETNLIAVGATPTAPQITEALSLLNNVIFNLADYQVNRQMREIALEAATAIKQPTEILMLSDLGVDYVPENTRLTCDVTVARSVYLDPAPQDGARFTLVDIGDSILTHPVTVYGNGRTINGLGGATINDPTTPIEFFYRADLGDWVRMLVKLVSDSSPFPQIYDDLLMTSLAIRLASRYGKPLSGESQLTYSKLLAKFKAQYQQTIEKTSDLALLRLSTDKYKAYGSNTRDFNLGRY